MALGKRVTIAINSLVQGGAQKAGILLVESLLKRGYSVQLVLFYPEETDFFSVPSGVEVVRLIHPFESHGIWHDNKYIYNYRRAKSRILDLIQLRKIIRRHQSSSVIAFETYVGILVGLALLGSKTRVIISERVHPKYHELQKIVAPFKAFVFTRKNVRVVAQGKVISDFIRGQYGIEVLSIPNIVLPPPKDFVYEPKKHVVMLARSDKQKGVDLLLKAWSQLEVDQKSTWTVHIYGQGEFGPYYDLVTEMGLENEVFFHDAIPNVSDILKNTGIFVLPSRYEGFPNALAEAISHGVPSLATDCPSAIRDLTLNGQLAILIPVDDVDSLAFQIMSLIADEDKRIAMSEKGVLIAKVFSEDIVTDIWEDAIHGLFAKEKRLRCHACHSRVSRIALSISKTRLIQAHSLESSSNAILFNYFKELPSVVRFWACSACGHLSAKALKDLSSYYRFLKENIPYVRSSRWDYEVFSAYTKDLENLSILDFGSGASKWDNLDYGKNSLTLLDITHDENLNELNEFRQIKTLQSVPANSQDHIVAFHVLEHLDNPLCSLLNIKSKLKKSGRLWVTVPDKDTSIKQFSHLDWPPHHFSRFSRHSLEVLGKRAGFNPIEYIPGVLNSYGQFDFMLVFEIEQN